jgi:hypothetical protein
VVSEERKKKLFDVEYGLPYVRAIFWQTVVAYDESEARSILLGIHSVAEIRSVTEMNKEDM